MGTSPYTSFDFICPSCQHQVKPGTEAVMTCERGLLNGGLVLQYAHSGICPATKYAELNRLGAIATVGRYLPKEA